MVQDRVVQHRMGWDGIRWYVRRNSLTECIERIQISACCAEGRYSVRALHPIDCNHFQTGDARAATVCVLGKHWGQSDLYTTGWVTVRFRIRERVRVCGCY